MTWNEWFDSIANDPTAAFGASGELYLSTTRWTTIYPHISWSNLYVGRSYDGGLSVPTWVQSTFNSGVDAAVTTPNLVVDRTHGAYAGHAYVAFGAFSAGGPDSINVGTSSDGGATWSIKKIDDVAADHFHTDVATLSAATGGTVNFTVNPGPLYQTTAYRILGSVSGTTPGLDLGSVHLPLNYDLLMLETILLANSSALPGFAGTLDATGAATASLVSGPLPPSLVGFQMDFAALVEVGSAFRWASDATHLEIGN